MDHLSRTLQNLLRCLGLASIIVFHAHSSYGESLREGWDQAGSFLIDEAHQFFKNQKEKSASDESERMLGEAITLLNIQPRTSRNLNKAQRIFTELEKGEGDPAVFAGYFLARMAEMYSEPPRYQEARARYRDGLARHAGHPLAERGASALVLIDIYEPVSPEERASRFTSLEALEPALKTNIGKRDFHLNMGNAYIYFPQMDEHHQRAITHLKKADELGITRWQVESATWISIGELARARGEQETAILYYNKFLQKYPRDNRHYTIKERLKELLDNRKEGVR